MARISKAPEERRREIIDTAWALFMQKGYEQTTVRDIVGALGVAQGLFYYYFKSKEDVLLAAMEAAGAELIAQLAGIIADGQVSPIARLRSAMACITAFLMQRRGTLMLPNESGQLRGKFERQTREMLAPYLEALLRDGQASGDFDVPYPGYTVKFFLSGFISLCTEEGAPSAQETSQLLQTLIGRLLALPEGALSAQTEGA